LVNADVDAILSMLRSRGLYAGISTNLIARPKIARENLAVAKSLTFSLSGFSQETYQRIHGGSLGRVLENFEFLYGELRKNSPGTAIVIAWHRYRFNEHELWNAFRHFRRPGVRFTPLVAYLNDLAEMLDLLGGRLTDERKRDAERDLFLDHIIDGIALAKGRSDGYRCPAFDSVVVDEVGQVLLCCGVTRYDSDYVIGDLSSISVDEMWRRKCTHAICNQCASSGLALWLYNQEAFKKDLPRGGSLAERLTMWRACNNISLRSRVLFVLRALPGGDKMIRHAKHLLRGR
jgi:hypothetical protein